MNQADAASPVAPVAEAARQPERDWVAASWRSVRAEARLYAFTLRRFLFATRAFVQTWRERPEALMNPLGFLALSVLVLGTVRSLGWWTLERAGSRFAAQFAGEEPFWAELWEALGPALHFAALGLICHYTLRLLGNRTARASCSAAMTFYAAGSVALVLEAVVWVVTLALLAADVVPITRIYTPLFSGFGLALAGFCAGLGFSLGVLHAPRWWHMPVAFLAAFVLTGLFFGQVRPPGEFGIRWYLQLWDEHGWKFLLELRL